MGGHAPRSRAERAKAFGNRISRTAAEAKRRTKKQEPDSAQIERERRAQSPCTLSRPSLATPPSPSSACSRSSRACSLCYRVFLRSRVSLRTFASCCCAALSHAPQSHRARSPCRLAVQAPCRTRVTLRSFASGVAALLLARVRLALLLLCVALADSLLAHSPARAHPDASPRTPRTDRPLTFGTRARFLCASHGFLRALCTAGSLLWSDCLAYDLSFAVALVLCVAWLFLQRRLCAHLPHWRVLRWRRCAECFVLPCDGVYYRWIERAAAMLLECEKQTWERYGRPC